MAIVYEARKTVEIAEGNEIVAMCVLDDKEVSDASGAHFG